MDEHLGFNASARPAITRGAVLASQEREGNAISTRGWENATATDVRDRRVGLAKPSKYHAVKTTVEGITFDSKAEAARYGELRLLERAGHIARLMVQPRFALFATPVDLRGQEIPGRPRTVIGEYVADFAYDALSAAASRFTVEDVKGAPRNTALFNWKKRHFEAQYGVTIQEIR